MYALADCNSFYASCEQVFNRKLRDRPVVVLSNNDGCIVTRSREAKPLIPMGAPYFKMKPVIEENRIAVFSSNYALYGDMSRRVMDTFRQLVAEVEVYSIDEAFLDMRGYPRDLVDYARHIRETVRQWTGIPTSIGVGPTKTLAKVANRMSKQVPSGVIVLSGPAEIEEALRRFPIGEVWGIGRRYQKFLQKNGVETAWDLRQQPESWVKQHMSIVGLRLVRELKGQACLPLELVTEPKKQILVSRTFPKVIPDLETMEEKISFFATRAAEKLRQQSSRAHMIHVFLRTDSFKKDQPQHRDGRLLRFPVATNYTPDIVKYARAGMRSLYREGYLYRKAGLMLTGLIPDSKLQLHLFSSVPQEELAKKDKLMRVMDQVNQKLGKNKLKIGSLGEANHFMTMQKKLSGRFTTNWKEILVVKR